MTRIIEDVKFDFQDVLLMPKRSELASRSEVSLQRTYKFKHSTVEYTGVPILAANMDHTGTFEMADALKKFDMGVALHKFYTPEQLTDFYGVDLRSRYTFYSMGITNEDLKKFEEVWSAFDEHFRPKYVCIDVANGYSRNFVVFVEQMRAAYPDIVIMAGNVVTADMTYDLLERGADIIKVGIGPGSVCTTRKITGVGYPQLSAIMECADAAHGANGLICGDGGVTSPGDVAKAFAAGADFVMCGGLFAGHQECSGKIIGDIPLRKEVKVLTEVSTDPTDFGEVVRVCHLNTKTNDRWIQTFDKHTKERIRGSDLPMTWYDPELLKQAKMRFYGMSSQEAMDVHYGGKANYRASEGKAVEVPYKGPVASTVEEILGGLRSACTYTGAKTLKQLPKCATFVKVGRQLNTVFGE
jgi:GMP reductase